MTRFPVDNLIVYDIEVYPNYFVAGFELPSGDIYQYRLWEHDPRQSIDIRRFLQWANANGYTLAGFNSLGYDDPVTSEMLEKPTVHTAYNTSYQIIHSGVKPWTFDNTVNSIDLMQVLPGRISLKKIGVAMAHERLQELPFDPHTPLEPWQMEELDAYNINDLQITRKLVHEIQKELNLRQVMSDRYNVDVRSKGEAAIAEVVLTEEYRRLYNKTGKELKDAARNTIPKDGTISIMVPTWWGKLHIWDEEFPSVKRVRLKGAEIFTKTVHLVDRRIEKGALNASLFIGDRWYTMGVGGLHSADGPGSWVPEDDEMIVDIDVTSYYPFLMITQNLFPRHWGAGFIDIYKKIVDTRLQAKSSGDTSTANVLKIVINGTYGKTADPFSALYDPQVTANVTVRGQLALLTLIAMLNDTGGNVISANTDGLSLLCKKSEYEKMKGVVSRWEEATGLNMEYTEYTGVYQADVNNYIAVKTNGELKCKGKFLTPAPGKADLRHAPIHQICARAVQEFLQRDAQIEETIKNCTDLQEFVITQQITRDYSVSWNGSPMPNMVRFYKSVAGNAAPILKQKPEGNPGTVSLSDKCVPVIDLPENFPLDIDYEWYIAKAKEWLNDITRPKVPYMNTVAMMLIQRGVIPTLVNTQAKRLSRAKPEVGEIDFNSIGHNESVGVATGRNYMLMAKRDSEGNVIKLIRTDKHYPSKTRAVVMKNEGFELLYGGNVPVDPYNLKVEDISEHLDQYYTETELSKVIQ